MQCNSLHMSAFFTETGLQTINRGLGIWHIAQLQPRHSRACPRKEATACCPTERCKQCCKVLKTMQKTESPECHPIQAGPAVSMTSIYTFEDIMINTSSSDLREVECVE